MSNPFATVHVRRLLRLARLIEKSHRFTMGAFAHDCGSPACVAGHGVAMFKLGKPSEAYDHAAELGELLTGYSRKNAGAQDQIYEALFNSSHGAGGAGKSGRKAARYIREVFIPALRTGTIPAPANVQP